MTGLHCLWLSRMYPYPFTTADRRYSALLAASLAEQGVYVKFLCFGDKQDVIHPSLTNLSIERINGGTRPYLHALASSRPLVSARHNTRSYRRALQHQLTGFQWDFLVIDQIGME